MRVRALVLVLFLSLITLLVTVASAQSTVHIAQSLGHNSLNPAEASGLSDASVVRTMFEGLVGFDENFELVPELATSWTVNDDATVLDFTLREGVTFHDGTPFNAEAVKAYYEWVLDPDSQSARGRGVLANIDTIEVMSPFEVRITLKEPSGAMLYNLALSNSRIASPASLEQYPGELGRHPVGTGPFKFVSWQESENVVVEAYEGYWGEPARVERLEFLIVPNAATRVALLQSGEAQFIEDLPPQLIEPISAAPNLEVLSNKTTFLRILELNTQHPPFDDVRVRQAMNYAVDKEQLVNVVFRGYATVMTSPLPELVFGQAPQTPYEFDPERARQLLTEAGYPDGFSMKVLTFTGEEYSTAGQVLQQMFANVGIEMELDAAERGALVEQIFKPVEENITEAALVGASAGTGDADRALTVSFARESWPPTSNNWSFYENPEVEALIKAGRETGDPELRAEAYAQAQAIIWNDAPWVFLYSPDSVAGKVEGLEGVYYAADKTVDARRATLE